MSSKSKPKTPSKQAQALSTHRFQDRRQQRMRGAGNHAAIQRNFQFKPPSSNSTATASSNQVQSTLDIRRDRPSTKTTSTNNTTTASYQAKRRIPTSSTPAASRSRRNRNSTSLSTLRQDDPEESQAARAEDDVSALGSQASDDDDDGSGAGGDDNAPLPSPPSEISARQPDLSLPEIPLPPPSIDQASARRSARRAASNMASTSRLSNMTASSNQVSFALPPAAGDESLVSNQDSPAANAAKRGAELRRLRRQASPTDGHPHASDSIMSKRPRSGPKPGGDGPAKGKGRSGQGPVAKKRKRSDKIMEEPVYEEEEDDDEGDVTLQESRIQAGGGGGPVSGVSAASWNQRGKGQKEFKKRLNKALSLVFCNEENFEQGGESGYDFETSTRKKRMRMLNDADVIWSVLDEELKVATESQAAQASKNALKAIRKSTRSTFSNLSFMTDQRTELIGQLIKSRKRKKELRRQVYQARMRVVERVRKEEYLKAEIFRLRRIKENTKSDEAFLSGLRRACKAWT
ncbi:hypothetical protein IE53DRAFT_385158 [Violaceomyces palustris]|uniref:Uncharacterized protein n=1 Tax=Violaceomyces palustris TaxID=1673888 RepID=A0ACD0P388_9BASI|nr:hypothetical protein IE53DRAFT_385158 [Violaceomyces palustris]